MNIEKTLPKAWESIETKLAKGTYNGSASDLKSLIDGKESSISKKSGFNLDKSDAINSNVSTTLATSAAVKTAYDKGVEALTNSNTKLTKGNLPAKITNAEDMYKLLENKSGLEFDPNLLYLNDAGTKTTGKAYFDRNKKGIFKCIQTTSSTTNSTTYFVDFSNNANSDRLTNLDKKSWFSRTFSGTDYNNIEYINTNDSVQEFKILSEGLYFISTNSLIRINEKISCYINDIVKTFSPWTNGTYNAGGSTFTYVTYLKQNDIIKIEFTNPRWGSDTSICIFKIK